MIFDWYHMTYSLDLRKKVVDYIQKGGRIAEAIKLFGVSRKSIERWLNQLETAGHMNKKPYIRTKHKIDRETLKLNIAEAPDAYLKDRAETLNVSVSGVWRALKTMKITRKKKSAPTKSVMKKNG